MSEELGSGAEPTQVPEGETGVVSEEGGPVNPEGQEETQEQSPEEFWADLLAKNPLKLKVNGQEREIKDFAELKKHAGLGNAAHLKMQEAARLKQEAEQTLQKYKEANILDLMKERGLEGEAVYEEITKLIDTLEKEREEDPKDRKLREYEEAERKRREEEEARRTEEEQKVHLAKVEEFQQQLASDIHQAAEKLGMPETPFLLKQVADELDSAWVNGLDLSAEEAVRLVQHSFVSEYAPYVREMGVDLVEQVLGDDMVKALRKKWIGEAKQAEAPFSTPRQKKRGEQQAQTNEEDLRSVDLSPRGKYGKLFSK